MKYNEKYELWKTFNKELSLNSNLLIDEKDIEDRFYKDLEFGTGGLRGLLGIGTNRMNIYTVRRATFGIANYLNEKFKNEKSVVIAYDSRNYSRKFADEVASTLCACNIRVYLFNLIMPTPILSYAVKYLHCSLGIMITASHNPKEYNGYKVYDSHGCQIVPMIADELTKQMNLIINYEQIPNMSFILAQEKGMFNYVNNDVLDTYLEVVNRQIYFNEPTNLKVVYTPLHGTGNIPVRRILEGYNVSIVEEQELPDGNFPTVKSPNPEENEALTLALLKAQLVNADLILATDPDCDRIGVAVKHYDKYKILTGNQIGALLTEFILTHRKNSQNDTIIKTIVTNDLGSKVAQKYGVGVIDTLTGFKYIGEQITRFEESGKKNFVLGYEESYGFLIGTHARDKDAVVASKLICEMTAYYLSKNMTLIDAIDQLYFEHGYYLDKLDSFTYNGKDGLEKIVEIMNSLRIIGRKLIPNIKELKDYNTGIEGLNAENVLKFILNDESWFAIRPSGTEPKIKIYYSIRDIDLMKAEKRLKYLQDILGRYLE